MNDDSKTIINAIQVTGESAMTAKEWEAIAAVLLRNRPSKYDPAHDRSGLVLDVVAQELADIFQADSPYFLREGFLAHAGCGEEEHGRKTKGTA